MVSTPKDSVGRKRRTDGEGSVYHDEKRGKWVGALVLGYRDGKPIRKRVTANTKSGAANRLRELREQHERETLPANGRTPTVEQWMNHWLTNIARKVSPLTLENSYRQKTRDYIIPLLGHHRLDKLTPDHIEAAWDVLSEDGNPKRDEDERQPLKPNTVLQTHRILSRALLVAQQRKHIRSNPAAKESMDAPSGSQDEMAPLSPTECRQVLAAAAGTRNAARWSVALALGLRQGEALGLRWEDVDLEDEVVHVRQSLQRIKGRGLVFGGLKSDAGRRDVALPDALVAELKAHKAAQGREKMKAGTLWDDHGLVFCQVTGKPLDPSRDWKAWRNLLKAAKVDHRRLHDARHSAATMLLAQGVPTRVVMQILGHSQISVTMRYQHVVDEMQRDAAAKTSAALWG
jgi:integrase